MLTNIKTPQQLESERLEHAATAARSKRNQLISDTDYIMQSDYPMADKTAIGEYRQALRDITAQTGFPDTIDWPVKP